MIRRLIVSAVLVATASIATPVVATESAAPLSGVNGFHALVRLEPGTSGTDVADLQQALADAGFYHFEIDGVFGKTTISAVIAFHKYLRAERTTTFNALDWIRLALLPNPGIPYRWNESDYIEVDVGRQLLFLVRDGEVVQVLPVSTGGGYTYWSIRQAAYVTARTPHGDFVLRSHQRGWSCDSVTGWCVYKPRSTLSRLARLHPRRALGRRLVGALPRPRYAPPRVGSATGHPAATAATGAAPTVGGAARLGRPAG
jgi:hypothetical protein